MKPETLAIWEERSKTDPYYAIALVLHENGDVDRLQKIMADFDLKRGYKVSTYTNFSNLVHSWLTNNYKTIAGKTVKASDLYDAMNADLTSMGIVERSHIELARNIFASVPNTKRMRKRVVTGGRESYYVFPPNMPLVSDEDDILDGL